MLGGSPYDARPCDRCRRGKRRCDGPQQPNGVCARCVRAAKNCTYSESSGREKAYPKGYVQALEARVAEVERLLREEVPEALLMQELGNMTLNTLPSVETPSSNLRALAQSDDESDPIQAVASLYETERWVNKFEHPDGHHRWRNPDLQGGFDAAQDRVVVKRPEYWRIPDHEFRGERLEERDFRPVLPPPDELASFMRRYFETSNVVRPIFHRRLFEQRLLSADAMRDRHFLAAVLLVCAIGEGQLAADSADSDNSGSAGSSKEKMPAGYQFFVQAEPLLRMPPPAEPQLLDVQLFFLAAQYIGVVLGKPTAFIPFGTALQLAYQARAHRRSSYKQYPNLLDELWKRTFWSLVVTDRAMSSLFGRPLSIKDDSFDLDLPLEVDDDRWDIATPGFPLRGASIRDLCPSSFFAWHVRLNLILGFVIQTVYSTNRSRVLMGFVGADWEQRTLSQLDALLTEWETTVPKDLGWNSDATNLEMFVQSAVLHTSFYTLIIIAHNPFMRTTAGNFARANMLTTTGLDLAASLEICTNAALQCSDILTTLIDKHPGCFALPGWSEPPFVSCMVLLVNLFGFESRLTNADIKRMTRAVRTCLNALRLISTRLRLALVWW
ncbi:fungal-specific transcription factor domain-containing protein [Auriculariales sp. MPI-PUGE-AT-0066]|nr:fungal-specific transcription factor domain-containing protein [Auriculariales sp. MPI-PUGE-AT-0066]